MAFELLICVGDHAARGATGLRRADVMVSARRTAEVGAKVGHGRKEKSIRFTAGC